MVEGSHRGRGQTVVGWAHRVAGNTISCARTGLVGPGRVRKSKRIVPVTVYTSSGDRASDEQIGRCKAIAREQKERTIPGARSSSKANGGPGGD